VAAPAPAQAVVAVAVRARPAPRWAALAPLETRGAALCPVCDAWAPIRAVRMRVAVPIARPALCSSSSNRAHLRVPRHPDR
jgi:hypothetical protein